MLKPKSQKSRKSKKPDTTKSAPRLGAKATESELLKVELNPKLENGKISSSSPDADGELSGSFNKENINSSSGVNLLTPNYKKPKKDVNAGFDIGFPIDTYISAAYILATLSQSDENSSKKGTSGRKPTTITRNASGGSNASDDSFSSKTDYALKYTLPSSSEKNSLLEMIANLNKRFIFDLAHNTLKYKNLFEEVLVESDFFAAHPFSDDQNSLLMVYLVDLNNREWVFRPEFESDGSSSYLEDFKLVEDAVKLHEVKLHAALAKKRVANQSLSINFALPKALRAQEQNRGLVPISAWAEDGEALKALLSSDPELSEMEEITKFNSHLLPNQYKLDKNLDNVIHFYGKNRDQILRLNSVKNQKLIIQEKSTVLAVDSCFKLLNALEPADIFVTNVGAGWTVLQVALRLKKYSQELIKRDQKQKFLFGTTSTPIENQGESSTNPEINQNICKVYCPFNGTETAYNVVMQRFQDFDVLDHIEIIRQPISHLLEDERLKRVKTILIVNECSRTSVADPIEVLIQESQPDLNMNQLLNLKPQGSEKSADNLAAKHLNTLKYAVNSNMCPNSNAIIYLTRSVHKSENENVINNALNSQTGMANRKWGISAPVVLLRPQDVDKNSGKFLSLSPSPFENGCFLAVLTRRGTQQKDAAKEMVKKAALQGLIDPGI